MIGYPDRDFYNSVTNDIRKVLDGPRPSALSRSLQQLERLALWRFRRRSSSPRSQLDQST